MSWTDERIETLRSLWEKGLTASQIADKLGNVSRNAVIGKAHRLGLKARPSPVKGDSDGTPRETAKKAAAPAAPKPKPEAAAQEASAPQPRPAPEAKVPPAPAAAAPKPAMPVRAAMPAAPVKPRAPGEKVTLLDLSDKICKWPIGHPGEPDFQFCGRPVNPGFPYCTAHCAEAYQAQLPRDRSRPSRAPMPPLPRVR
ncbi:MAG: GcrA cell cycle regulator [Sphingosinicella sp.]|nr:GcrA cell cycle regulator [Sphingosinicella sp.]